MGSVLDKEIVLKLNALWQRIGYTTPRKAFVAQCGGAYGGTPASLGVDVHLDADGRLTSESRPVAWDEWVELPIRPGDLSVFNGRRHIRVPTVLIEPNFKEMPEKKPKLTKRAVFERDGYIDQYTGEKLSRRDASVDHVRPRSRGGQNSWDNLVTTHKRRNSQKGNRLNHEIGLKPIRKPVAPRPVPVCVTIKEVRHPHHQPFIND
jgi:hypothetical protein